MFPMFLYVSFVSELHFIYNVNMWIIYIYVDMHTCMKQVHEHIYMILKTLL